MSGSAWFDYDRWPSRDPDDWDGHRGHHADDNLDFHVDLGCGRIPKGRIGVDRYPAPGVAVIADFDMPAASSDPVTGVRRTGVATFAIPDVSGADAELPDLPSGGSGLMWRMHSQGLPFAADSIESVITHHALEHVGDGFIPLMEEVHRVLKPGGVFRIIVPLFPSWAAGSDPDHRRMFMADDIDGGHCTFDSFCGTPGDDPSSCWLASFSVPYTVARFERTHLDFTMRSSNPLEWWTWRDAREIRVTLRAVK